jgi:hypothetical protein
MRALAGLLLVAAVLAALSTLRPGGDPAPAAATQTVEHARDALAEAERLAAAQRCAAGVEDAC